MVLPSRCIFLINHSKVSKFIKNKTPSQVFSYKYCDKFNTGVLLWSLNNKVAIQKSRNIHRKTPVFDPNTSVFL